MFITESGLWLIPEGDRMTRKQNQNSIERSRFTKDCIVQSLLNLMDEPKDFQEYLLLLFEHLLDQKELGIKLQKAGMLFLSREAFDKTILSYAKDTKSFYNLSFFAGGLFNLYEHWLVKGCKETPKQLSGFFAKQLNLFSDAVL